MKRHDIYGRVHKGLRALMADAMLAAGRMDRGDDCDVRDAVARVEEMLAFCEKHAANENEFIHRAAEARRPGAYAAFSADHVEHSRAVEELRGHARERSADLHRRVASFVADNLHHMESEEREGNALLWALFSDAELQAIEARLVASMPPGHAMQALRWMLPAMSHPERVAMLEAMRQGPPGVLEGALALARTHLRGAEAEKLDRALAQREPATLAS